MTSRSTASVLSLLLAIAAAAAPAAAAPAAAPARSLAVGDFAVRTPASRAARDAWLGAAVAELLSAKMQLFGGARVLERSRTPLGAEAVPAAVLIFGSVEVAPEAAEAAAAAIAPAPPAAPTPTPARIRVQARAVETETSVVLSEAAFSGATDLAGLLQVAEALAKHLADALGFAYTPAQLAYAEPAGLDALQAHLAGNAHLEAGRHREALAAYQRALDGNGGKYYPAAHRAQGEAYRALAASLAGEEARRAREEYLAKFRADALAASGALFDLGTACEANGLWREALQAYDDYLAAVGGQGETVRWSFKPETIDIRRAVFTGPPLVEGDRIHSALQQSREPADSWWVTLDAASGAVLSVVPLPKALGIDREAAAEIRLFGVAGGRAFVTWQRVHGREPDGTTRGTWFGDPGVAALSPAGSLLWKIAAGDAEQRVTEAIADGGRIFLGLHARSRAGEGLVLDAASGAVLERFLLGPGTYDIAAGRLVPPYFDPKRPPPAERWKPGVRHETGRPGITFSVGPATVFYEGERPVATLPARMVPVFAAPPLAGEDVPLVVFDGAWKYHQLFPTDWTLSQQLISAPPSALPAGLPGVTVFGWGAYTRIFQDGRQVLRIPRAAMKEENFTPPARGWLVLAEADGTVDAVDPEGWRVLRLYEGARVQPAFLAQDERSLVFSLRHDPQRGRLDPRYDVAATERGSVLNIVAKPGGEMVAKHFVKELRHLALAGHDPVVVGGGAITRLRLASTPEVAARPAAEAHLRRATVLLELGDAPAAGQALARFESEVAGDPRAALVRLALASRRGDGVEAARQGLRALASGGLGEADARASLAAIRAIRPEVRDVIATRLPSRLILRSAVPGTLVATLEGPAANGLHALVDTASGSATVVRTPEFAVPGAWNLRYRGLRVLWLDDREAHGMDHVTDELVRVDKAEIDSRHRVVGVDLLSGARAESGTFLLSGAAWLPGDPPRVAGRQRQQGVILELDAGSLAESGRLGTGGHQARTLSTDGTLVLDVGVGTGEDAGGERSASFLLIDPASGAVAGTATLDLAGEAVVAAAADADRLLVGLNSLSPGQARVVSLARGPRGRDWSWRGEGRIAGNIVLEGDRVAFPLAAPKTEVARVSLDLETGSDVLSAPLAAVPWGPPSPGSSGLIRIFPASAAWRPERERDDVHWDHAPGRLPLQQSAAADGCRVVVEDEETALRPRFLQPRDAPVPAAVCGDTVYESIGGGVLLVKEFAGGRGLERVIRDARIGLLK